MGWFKELFGKKSTGATSSGMTTTSSTPATPQAIINDLTLAEQIYANNPYWLHETNPPIEGSGVGAVAAMEVARLITLEAKIDIEADKVLNDVLSRYVMRNLRIEIEKGWALGGLVMKPFFVKANATITDEGVVQEISGNLKIDFFYPGYFLIHSFDRSGEIHDIAFYTIHKDKYDYYVLEERQIYDEIESTTTITNVVYHTKEVPRKFLWDNLGVNTVPLTTVERWANIQPKYVFEGVNGVLCGFYKPPIANNTDLQSPYGKSPLVRAQNAIRRVDRIEEQLDWEMDVSRARLYIDETAYNHGRGMPSGLSKFIVRLIGNPHQKFFEKFNPNIRDESYLRVMDRRLKSLEDAIGLSHGTLSIPPQAARTATELKVSFKRTITTVKDNRAALVECLNQLIYAMAVWSYPSKEIDHIKAKFLFDESIFSDPQDRLRDLMQMQYGGNVPKWYVNMICLSITEEEAKKLVAEAEVEKFSKIVKTPEGELARDYPGIDPIYSQFADKLTNQGTRGEGE